MMNEKWFSLSVAQIEQKLKTNAASGLSRKAARSRCDKKSKPFFTVKKKTPQRLLTELLSDFFLVMLVLVAFFSLFFDGYKGGAIAILILVTINLALAFFVHYRSTRSMESMNEFFAPTARVIRGGKLYIADYRDVVEGDVILIEKGDIIGCDARLIHSDSLKVNMRVDKKNTETLEKYAHGHVAEEELYAKNMVNMVHAGSVVEEGSGRAVVVATGDYTYLGAMTGGISDIPSQELPKGLSEIRAGSHKMGLLLLLLILPFCMLSLLFSHLLGGRALLSDVLILALSVGSTALLKADANIFNGFFTHRIKRVAVSEDPCIFRSVEAFDKISDVDYLFMLDGSAATDGILHFNTLVTADGEIRSLGRMGQGASFLAEMVAQYVIAREGAVSLAVNSNGDIDVALREYMKESKIDAEALKIRCPIRSYIPSADTKATDIVTFTQGGVLKTLRVARTVEALDQCGKVMVGGSAKDIGGEGRKLLADSFYSYIRMGKYPLIFTLSNGSGAEGDTQQCFLGMLILEEGIDTTALDAVTKLKSNGVRVITFTNCTGRGSITEIPEMLRKGQRAYASDFELKSLPISYKFGEFEEYCGFGEADVKALARLVKSSGKSLGIIGFSEYASEAIELADVFLTCAPVRTGVFGHFDEEVRMLEIPGEQNSASCTQTVKAGADVLLMRPSDGKGGLAPLSFAISECAKAYRNLNNFFVYFLGAQAVRLITIIIPMLLGMVTADARHMLLYSCVIDFSAMLIFMYDNRRAGDKAKKRWIECGRKGTVRKNLALFVCLIISSVILLVLPNIFGAFDAFGGYLYKTEFTFIATALLQIALLICVFIGERRREDGIRRLLRSRAVLAMLAVMFVFTLLCFIITPLGNMFELERSPWFYTLLSFVPTVIFVPLYMLLGEKVEWLARKIFKL